MPERTLIVGDSGLTTAVASAVVADGLLTDGTLPTITKGSAGLLWLPTPVCPPNQLAARRNALDLLAGTYGFELSTAQGAIGDDLAPHVDDRSNAGLGVVALGLVAVSLALRTRCTRIVWAFDNAPGESGPESVPLDAASRTLDRCILLERLALNEIGHEILIEAPYADLSDTQLAEIALDLGVPLRACWWWGSDEPADRWRTALDRAGWPEHLLPPLPSLGRTGTPTVSTASHARTG